MSTIIFVIVLVLIAIVGLVKAYYSFSKVDKIGLVVISVSLIVQLMVFFHVKRHWDAEDRRDDYPEYFYKACGKVTERIDGFERHGKHHNEYFNEYLVVLYDNGNYDRVKVNRDTYEKHPVDSRICFEEKTSEYTDLVFGRIGWIVLIVICIIVNLIYAFKTEED